MVDELGPPVVALSATYGAGGRYVGERVAGALQVRFLDHVLSAVELEQEQAAWEAGATGGQLLRNRLRGDQAIDDQMIDRALTELESHERLTASDTEVLDLVRTGGVVVGRAAPHLLREVPGVLRVLLDGPTEWRIAHGASEDGIDLSTARRHQRAHDASRLRVARRRYGADPTDLRYFDVVLDTSTLGLDPSVGLVLQALEARRARSGQDAP